MFKRLSFHRKGAILLFACVLVLPNSSKAQNPDLTSNRLEVSIMPYSLIDYNPRFRMGLEYYSHEKLGFSFDMSYGNNTLKGTCLSAWGDDYELTEYRTQVNYFFILKKYFALYTGPELFLIRTKDVLYNSFFKKPFYTQGNPENTVTQYSQANFFRQKMGMNLKVGVKLIAFERIAFDFYAGIGIAHRNIEYSNVMNPENVSEPQAPSIISQRHAIIGRSYLLHFALGGKIGIILWEKEKSD